MIQLIENSNALNVNANYHMNEPYVLNIFIRRWEYKDTDSDKITCHPISVSIAIAG